MDDKEMSGLSPDRALFLALDQKIDKIKDNVRELFQRDQANQEKIDRLTQRIDFGVSKTGQQNSSKITELAVKMNDLEHEMAANRSTMKHLEKVLGRIMTGIFWVSFAGVLGGLIALAYQVLKMKLIGG